MTLNNTSKAKKGSKILVLLGSKDSKVLRNRAEFAKKILIIERPDLIIITGGKTDKNLSSEAQRAQEILQPEISKIPIILEEHSYSTYENILLTKDLLKDQAISKLTFIVSKSFEKRVRFYVKYLWPEILNISTFLSSEETAPRIESLKEFFYLLLAHIDPKERIIGRVAKKLFRNKK